VWQQSLGLHDDTVSVQRKLQTNCSSIPGHNQHMVSCHAESWSMTWSLLLLSLAAHARTQHSLSFDSRCNRAIIFGGYSSNHGYLNDVWVLDFDSRSAWQPSDHGELPAVRRGHCAEVVGNRLWVVGGAQASGVVNDVASLCLETWEWSQVLLSCCTDTAL
jgi:hypothetical protein